MFSDSVWRTNASTSFVLYTDWGARWCMPPSEKPFHLKEWYCRRGGFTSRHSRAQKHWCVWGRYGSKSCSSASCTQYGGKCPASNRTATIWATGSILLGFRSECIGSGATTETMKCKAPTKTYRGCCASCPSYSKGPNRGEESREEGFRPNFVGVQLSSHHYTSRPYWIPRASSSSPSAGG